MKYIPPERWRAALVVYASTGLALGLCNRPLNLLALHSGVRPGIGTAVNVNLLMPLVAMFGAWFYPRLRTIWFGSIIASGMFYLGMRLVQVPNVTQWSARATLVGIDPILVAACIGYGIVGSVTALILRYWRVVGLPDAAQRCRSCGYLLVGLTGAMCPECGAPFDSASLR
jgi:hypothetical protein